MRWFMDTEFDENGTTIKLISIALVSEEGEELSFCMNDGDGWRSEDCNEWVKANVLPKLDPPSIRVTRKIARSRIKATLLRDGDTPEIWAYFGDYDWVAFCQLLGTMMDLPKGMPMFCMDLKQEMVRRGITKEMLPPQPVNAHDALADARWCREAWLSLNSQLHAPFNDGQTL